MLKPNIDAIFEPKSIAIVGATPDRTKIGGRVLGLLIDYGFPGKLYGINSRYDMIGDISCVADPEKLPEAVDLVILAIPAAAVVGVAEACARRGCRALIVMSSGFREAGDEGAKREAALLDIVKTHKMALIGPNADGIVNVSRGLAAVFATAMNIPGLQPGRVSLVTQSGAVGSFAISLARQSGIGLDYWVSTGNAALCEVHDFARYLIQSPSTDVVGLYVEGIRDGAGFVEVADGLLKAGKPAVLLKGGLTDAGQAAAATHTGSLAGGAKVWEGIAAAHGLVLTTTFQDFFDTVMAFGAVEQPVGPRVAVLTSSGAAGVLATDAAERSGIVWPGFTNMAGRLKELLPSSAIECPLDLPGVLGAPGKTETVLNAVAADENIDAIVLLTGAREEQGSRLAEEIVKARKVGGKPIFVSWTACPPETGAAFWSAGIPCFADASQAIEVVARLVKYWQRRDGLLSSLDARAVHSSGSRPDLSAESGMIGERESKMLIRNYGLTPPAGGLAESADEAAAIAEKIGYPVVMKVESPDVVHKTEAGGVVLRLTSKEEVRAAYPALVERVRTHVPHARITGAYVEKMAGSGVELLLGVSRDPQFGLCLMLGLGGIWAEALNDVAIRSLPVSRLDVEDMLSSLRGRALLEGARGIQVDREAVIAAALGLASLASDLGESLEAIDINPLLAQADGATVLDCRIQLRA